MATPDRVPMTRRRLFVAWQSPTDRSILPVAVLTLVVSDSGESHYYFSYLKRALHLEGFAPFSAFPDVHHLYSSNQLFPFFQNRVWSRKRADYGELLSTLDLASEAEPFEVLQRSGGRRETDGLEVFPEPYYDADSKEVASLFFARGLRHIEGADETASSLRVGDSLTILQECQNPVNPRALLVAKKAGIRPVGYVPDFLVRLVHDLLRQVGPERLEVVVHHTNGPNTPRHMRVLCRLRATDVLAYPGFNDPELLPVVEILEPER